MSQIFDLYVATETLVADAQQLGVTVEALQDISVQVSVTLVAQPEAYLQLTYDVTLPTASLAAQLTWPTWRADKVGFKDYLWQQTCLECFIAGSLVKSRLNDSDDLFSTNQKTAYIEINASPNGQYALYKFNSYRSPATLPPTPLLQADRQTRAFIDWHRPSKRQTASQTSAPKLFQYQRCFQVPLSQCYDDACHYGYQPIIDYLHPCVILSFGTTLLYFAPKHASPPDFHNRQYWTPFVA
ncbi:hypothetical protein [Psychrobacter sp.]|uniref:hypothetical protein n=1 Tax=Psychrobacter sp. TaxID=56811 RepID=UPI0035622247